MQNFPRPLDIEIMGFHRVSMLAGANWFPGEGEKEKGEKPRE